MDIKRVLTKYEKLSEELKGVVAAKFPFGIEEQLIKVPKGKDEYFFAFTFDHDGIRYMVKVSEGTVIRDQDDFEADDDMDTSMPDLDDEDVSSDEEE